jgi:Trypsin-like peptidase domain
MEYQKKSKLERRVEKFDRELTARGRQLSLADGFQFMDKQGTPERQFIMKQTEDFYQAAPPLNKALSHIPTEKLIKCLLHDVGEINKKRGIWEKDDRIDIYQIQDRRVIKNALCVAAICREKDLIDTGAGVSELEVKNYGESFNLCTDEPFQHQPIAAGSLCTGFLVAEDIIATAGHCVDEEKISKLCFIFGFKIATPSKPVRRIFHKNIYKGIKIIHRICDSKESGADWVLVKLDRKVAGQSVAELSKKEISCHQPLYILGHPCGLPLKYSAGAQVRDIESAFFSADLNIYCGNSGSPVFNRKTHEVIGLVTRGDDQDFRWTGKGWRSVIYSNSNFKNNKPQCTRVSEFIDYCDNPIIKGR